MRAIIIEDKDAKALLKQLELRKLQGPSRMLSDNAGCDKATFDEVHRLYHFEVCHWLQEQGCNVTS